MGTPADQMGMIPPGVDPSDWINTQRKMALAQALQGMSLSPAQADVQQPGGGGKYYQAARVRPITALSKIAEALMARRGFDQSLPDMARMYTQGMQAFEPGGGQPSAAPAPQPASGPAEPPPPEAAALGYGGGMPPVQVPRQPAPAAQPGATGMNPLNPGGLPPSVMMRLYYSDPAKYAALLQGTPEWQNALRASGGDSNRAMQIMRDNAIKQGAIDMRPGGLTRVPDGKGGYTLIRAPNLPPGYDATLDAQGNPIEAHPTPGLVAGEAEREGAITAAEHLATPRGEPDPLHPGQINWSYAPPRPGTQPPGQPPAQGQQSSRYFSSQPNAPTAADLEVQRAGAKAGVEYAHELSESAKGATEVRRNLAEINNLSQVAGPAGLNSAKAKLGVYLIAAGAAPDTVAGWLGVNVGAIQAAQKQTSMLAVNTIHSMTSRGTNFDLDVFMKNNPNLDMSDPSAFSRVVQYMDNKAKQDILRQQDFSTWKKGHSPDTWETDHTAHWLERQNKDIDAGLSNSKAPPAPAPAGGAPPSAIQAAAIAEARRRGLIK